MRRKNFIKLLLGISVFIVQNIVLAQNPVNWSPDQLMEPAQLAKVIKDNKAMPSIISIGPGAPIPHSVEIGSIKDKDSFLKFKHHLSNIDKGAAIVVYCGCCPFKHCPNVRPAIATLKEMKFSNYKLLNIPKKRLTG